MNDVALPQTTSQSRQLEPLFAETALPFHQTELGKRVLTGAAAGAAIGAAIPFISIIRGAMLGAGGLVLWKAFQDRA